MQHVFLTKYAFMILFRQCSAGLCVLVTVIQPHLAKYANSCARGAALLLIMCRRADSLKTCMTPVSQAAIVTFCELVSDVHFRNVASSPFRLFCSLLAARYAAQQHLGYSATLEQ